MAFKLFNIYDYSGITFKDKALKDYINLDPVLVPRNFGRHEDKRFWKSEDMNIVERLTNKMMNAGHKGKKHYFSSGRNTGKFLTNIKNVQEAFEIIQEKTNKNPMQMLVWAIENGAPMEEVVMIEFGGIRVQRAVDTAPQRRVDLALRWMTQGAYFKSVKSKTSAGQALAREIMNAANGDKSSFAVNKRNDAERAAQASR